MASRHSSSMSDAGSRGVPMKAVLIRQTGDTSPEVRRFSVDDDVSTSFKYLEEKLKTVYPILKSRDFKVTWKDLEGDDVVISSDAELLEALVEHAEMKDRDQPKLPFKVYVRIVGSNEQGEAGGDVLTGVFAPWLMQGMGFARRPHECSAGGSKKKDKSRSRSRSNSGRRKHHFHKEKRFGSKHHCPFPGPWSAPFGAGAGAEQAGPNPFGPMRPEFNPTMLRKAFENIMQVLMAGGYAAVNAAATTAAAATASSPTAAAAGASARNPSTSSSSDEETKATGGAAGAGAQEPSSSTGAGAATPGESWLDELCRMAERSLGISCPSGDDLRRALRGEMNDDILQMLRSFGIDVAAFQTGQFGAGQPSTSAGHHCHRSKEEWKKAKKAAKEAAKEAKEEAKARRRDSKRRSKEGGEKEEEKKEGEVMDTGVDGEEEPTSKGGSPKQASEWTLIDDDIEAGEAGAGGAAAADTAAGSSSDLGARPKVREVRIEVERAEAPAAKETQKDQQPQEPTLYPDVAEEKKKATEPVTSHPDPNVNRALQIMLNMGFTNEGGWLSRLLEAKKGDISEVLDVLRPHRKL